MDFDGRLSEPTTNRSVPKEDSTPKHTFTESSFTRTFSNYPSPTVTLCPFPSLPLVRLHTVVRTRVSSIKTELGYPLETFTTPSVDLSLDPTNIWTTVGRTVSNQFPPGGPLHVNVHENEEKCTCPFHLRSSCLPRRVFRYVHDRRTSFSVTLATRGFTVYLVSQYPPRGYPRRFGTVEPVQGREDVRNPLRRIPVSTR